MVNLEYCVTKNVTNESLGVREKEVDFNFFLFSDLFPHCEQVLKYLNLRVKK